jgi:hypothetical protein
MSGNNTLLLSEGTCYFGAGQLADKHFIPCGNANLVGPQACCYEGDYCLSSNVCWDADTVVTYIAGCTDPLFRADVCPQRYNYPDQQWVALANCNGTDIDLWTGCAYHPDEVAIEKENCNCNKSNVLIQNPNGKAVLDEIGLLPNKTGLPVVFNPTFAPTAPATSGSGGGLSTGAKAGIGVGVTIVGLSLIAGAAFLFLHRRRKQRQAKPVELDAEHSANEKSELASSDAGLRSELSPERGLSEMESPDQVPELDSVASTDGNSFKRDVSIKRTF